MGVARVSYLGGLLVGDDAQRALYGHEWISAIDEGGTQCNGRGFRSCNLIFVVTAGVSARVT